MSNKHTKLKKKPTIEQFMRAQIMKIKAVVPGMKVTIVARFPMDPDAEIVFSDDDIGGLIQTLQRRQHQVAHSQGREFTVKVEGEAE